MKKKQILSLIFGAMMMVSLGNSAYAEESQTGNEDTVVIENYGLTTEYDTIPERIVSLSYSETEILVALGLADKIVGIAEADNSIDVVSEEYKDTVSSLNIIASSDDGGVPSLEVLYSVEPDFVYGTVYSFAPNIGIAEPSDFLENDINIYVSTSTYKRESTIEDTYEDIRNIGKIFNVSAQAEEVIAQMQGEIEEAAEKINTEETKKRVFIYDSGESAALSFFGPSYESSLVELAGGVNVFDEEENSQGQVSWEAVVEANPDVIVINDWGGGSGASEVEDKINFLKSLPELQNVTAVEEENFVVVPLSLAAFGCIRNPEAVNLLAEGFYS
ncbi:MAG: ABC transporter substrate-binding protein [Eubacteriales bacterium]|nr:ABC transporter substrate-binding protein [Eubacteriales bacterium]